MVGSIIFHNFVVVASFFFNCFFDLFWEKYFEAHTISPTFIHAQIQMQSDRIHVYLLPMLVFVYRKCVSTKSKLFRAKFSYFNFLFSLLHVVLA
jgi:hypothetical protein